MPRITGAISNEVYTKEATLPIATLHRQSGLAQDFEENLWGSLVEVVTVYSGMNVRFTFRDGTIITA